MADDPIAAFALGSLAASRGASDLAAVSASLFGRPVEHFNRHDVEALISENQALRSDNALLREDVARLGRNIDRLSAWGDGLYAELVKAKGG